MHLDTIQPEQPTFADAAAASAEADASRVEVLREEVQILEAPLSNDQLIERGGELAATMLDIQKLDGDLEVETARHKVAKSRIVDEREELLAHAKHLGRVIRDKSDEQDVRCRVEKVFATGMIRTVRIDTGETIEERAMEGSERQADLFASVAPESFSDLHEDDPSEPPQNIAIHGKVILCKLDDAEGYHFDIELAIGTRVHVALVDAALEACDGYDVDDRVELDGHYDGEIADGFALFRACAATFFDPETEIDATKMATVGEHVEAKTNGKGRRK